VREPLEPTQDGWSPPGVRLRAWTWHDYLSVAGALVHHVLSLAWLRAPRWKNKSEARAELARLKGAYASFDHEFWAGKIDQTKRIEFTTAQGTSYQASVHPVWDDKPGGTIRVFLSIDDGGVGAFSPLSDCLLVDPASSHVSTGLRGR
jgi:hypothetical protein